MAVRKIYREGGIAREFLLKRVFWISFRNSVNGCFARSLTFLFNSSLLHHIILSTFSNVQHALHSDFSTQLKGIKKHLSIADYFFLLPFIRSPSRCPSNQASISISHVFAHRRWNCGSHSCIDFKNFIYSEYIYKYKYFSNEEN